MTNTPDRPEQTPPTGVRPPMPKPQLETTPFGKGWWSCWPQNDGTTTIEQWGQQGWDAAEKAEEERDTLAKRVEVLKKALQEIADGDVEFKYGQREVQSLANELEAVVIHARLALADAGEDVAQGKGETQ